MTISPWDSQFLFLFLGSGGVFDANSIACTEIVSIRDEQLKCAAKESFALFHCQCVCVCV